MSWNFFCTYRFDTSRCCYCDLTSDLNITLLFLSILSFFVCHYSPSARSSFRHCMTVLGLLSVLTAFRFFHVITLLSSSTLRNYSCKSISSYILPIDSCCFDFSLSSECQLRSGYGVTGCALNLIWLKRSSIASTSRLN